MNRILRNGDCVRLPDGRVGRVRAKVGDSYRVRVRRKSSASHEFVLCKGERLERFACPKGWMSPDGYRRYLRITLAKMRARQRAAGARRRRG